jgi:hypothetical protein
MSVTWFACGPATTLKSIGRKLPELTVTDDPTPSTEPPAMLNVNTNESFVFSIWLEFGLPFAAVIWTFGFCPTWKTLGATE